MATNPMQRKARNSFLLGILVTLIIAGIVITFLLFQLKKYKEEEALEQANSVKVWVLSQNVISGQVITTDMLTQQIVNKTLVPNNAIGDMSILNNYALEDKEGNEVITEYKNNVATLFLSKNGTKYQLKQEQETGSYYIENNGNKQYVELTEVPVIAKVDMDTNTVLTVDMITKSNEKTTDDLRRQEYNMLVLPSQLESGEYIDVRLALPNGLEYIVVSKKQVEIPQTNGIDSEDTIWINLTEEEIIVMNNAIVDACRMLGTKLYVTQYVEAGMQEAATPTYVPNVSVMKLIESNPNIIDEAKYQLIERYKKNYENDRENSINALINSNGIEGETNLQTKIDESIINSKENRKEYLESLGASY